MARQYLERRIDNLQKLPKELTAWEVSRNAAYKTVNWQFTTDDARIKLT